MLLAGIFLFMWRAANSCRCESSLTRLKSDSNPWMMDNVVYFTETKGSRFALCNDDAKGSLKLDGYGGTDTQPQPMVSMLLMYAIASAAFQGAQWPCLIYPILRMILDHPRWRQCVTGPISAKVTLFMYLWAIYVFCRRLFMVL